MQKLRMRKRSAYRLRAAAMLLGQIVEFAGLLAIVAVVLWVAIMEARDTELATYEQTPALTLIAVLGIAAHVVFERAVLVPEREREASRLRRQLTSIRRHMTALETSNDDLRQYIRAAGHYIQLQDLKSRVQSRNPEFAAIAEESLREPFLLLEKLSRGRIDVPEVEISSAMALLSGAYRQRIDAVSNEDLDFWLGKDSVAEDYLRQNKSAIRAGVVITRIFIIRIKDLETNLDLLKKILLDQYELGIRWGLCIADEFDSDVRHVYNARFDFALFDRGQAVSYFRKTPMRRFEAVFATGLLYHDNDREIARQVDLYAKLVGECWMVTSGFKEDFANVFSDNIYARAGAVESIHRRGRAHNQLLCAALGEDFEVEGDPFVLLARSAEEIEPKLHNLSRIIGEFRE